MHSHGSSYWISLKMMHCTFYEDMVTPQYEFYYASPYQIYLTMNSNILHWNMVSLLYVLHMQDLCVKNIIRFHDFFFVNFLNILFKPGIGHPTGLQTFI